MTAEIPTLEGKFELASGQLLELIRNQSEQFWALWIFVGCGGGHMGLKAGRRGWRWLQNDAQHTLSAVGVELGQNTSDASA